MLTVLVAAIYDPTIIINYSFAKISKSSYFKAMIILDAIFPVFALLVCGTLLKHFKFTNEQFLATSDKLVYYIFFPAMLFWKIGGADPGENIQSVHLCLAVILAVTIAWLISIAVIQVFSITRFKAGTFSQAAFRFNSYIGMAVVINTLGETGIRHFGILIGFVIPVINVLSVLTLIWYSESKKNIWENFFLTLKALISNPLILGCLAGIAFSRTQMEFPSFLDNTFSLMVAATMPLALISIGGSLKFAESASNTGLSLIACLIKLLALPAVGFLSLKMFGVSDIFFKVGMIYFTLPTSPSIFVLSSQMNSDTRLASTAVLVSTILSFVSLSVAVLM